jgi:ABC-type lipoprotein export system ATPase subunit
VEARLCCRQLSLFHESAGNPEQAVLHAVDAAFPDGAVSLVCGPNGAGKTSLLHLLAGLLRPTSGEVCWEGRAVSRWSADHRDRWRRQVGIVFQEAYLLEDLTALENVVAPLIPRGFSVSEVRRRGHEALAMLGAGRLSAEPVWRLSGGQRQRIGVARALAAGPELLLADEPVSNQDTDGGRRIKNALLALADQGKTVVVAGQTGDRLFDGGDPVHRFQIERGKLEKRP